MSEKGRAMHQAYVVTGTLTDDHTLALDEALPLQGGRVRVVVDHFVFVGDRLRRHHDARAALLVEETFQPTSDVIDVTRLRDFVVNRSDVAAAVTDRHQAAFAGVERMAHAPVAHAPGARQEVGEDGADKSQSESEQHQRDDQDHVESLEVEIATQPGPHQRCGIDVRFGRCRRCGKWC